MLKSGEEILAEIDATLDQLILNAQVAHQTTLYILSENEQEAFHKTQESLLARFVHMNDLLEDSQRDKLRSRKKESYEQIQNKIRQFGNLNTNILQFLANQFQPARKKQLKKPKIRRNRKASRKELVSV
jgi:hypothetical protein